MHSPRRVACHESKIHRRSAVAQQKDVKDPRTHGMILAGRPLAVSLVCRRPWGHAPKRLRRVGKTLVDLRRRGKVYQFQNEESLARNIVCGADPITDG